MLNTRTALSVLIAGTLVVGATAPPTFGDLLDINAVADASATEFDNGTAVQVDRETLTVTATNAGTALASVQSNGGGTGPATSQGDSAVFFEDPFSPFTEPIREFGGEMSAYSLAQTVHHQVTGDVFESRSIMITPAEAGLPAGLLVGVTGEMLLHGGILVWYTEDPIRSLDTLEALVGFEIELRREGLDPLFVLSGVIEVEGQGTSAIQVQGDGILETFSPALIDLSAEFPDLGRVSFIMFPQLLLPYAYTVAVNEEYELIGRLRLKGVTAPDGVGLAVTAGGPFMSLAAMLDEVAGSPIGTDLQARANAELAKFPDVIPPAFPFDLFQSDGGTTNGCAGFGVEGLGLTAMLGFIGLSGRGRRMFRPRA